MPNESETIVIAAAADRNYVLPLAVSLQSASANLHPRAHIEAYVIDDGIPRAERVKLASSLPERITLHWIERPRTEFAGWPNWGRMSLTTYHKVTLGDWLPAHLEKVIWLDADTLVLSDLARLWNEDLADHVALAAQDAVVPEVSSRFGLAAYRELGLPPQAKYFNAGVMLIDLARWRLTEVSARAAEYLRRYSRRVFFWDQEALNAVLAGHWGALDPRWNWNPLVVRLTSQRAIAPDAWIIHFSGNLKPWTYRGATPQHALYYEWLDQTAWRGWRPPRSWRGRAIAAYEASPLRARLYPLEQIHLRLVRWMTRR